MLLREVLFFSGKDLNIASDKVKTIYRRDNLGFVYQSSHLMPEFTALENVMVPLLIKGIKKTRCSKKKLWIF